MKRAKIAYIVPRFGNGSLSLFSSLAAAGISAEVRLFCDSKAEMKDTLVFETIANNIRTINPHNKSDIIYTAEDNIEITLNAADIVLLESAVDGNTLRRFCPNAWCIYRGENAVKAMQTIHAGFSDIKLLLSDDQTDSVRDLLYEIIKSEIGVEKPKRRDLVYNLCGMPAFCFLSDIFYNGEPLDAAIRHFADGKGNDTDDYRLSFYQNYGLLPASSNEIQPSVTAESEADFRKLIHSLRYGEAVLPVGNFTDCALLVKSLLGGGNLVTDVGMITDGKVAMSAVLVQKNACRRLV
jgi:hypothetical protein